MVLLYTCRCYTEQECYARSKGALGTSKAWPATMPFSLAPAGFHFRQWEMGCMNAEGNTLDMDCNALYLPYGDGASFAGFRAKPWPVPGTNDSLWFRGIKNLDAAIDWALLHGLADATELVVTGVSAGGLSTGGASTGSGGLGGSSSGRDGLSTGEADDDGDELELSTASQSYDDYSMSFQESPRHSTLNASVSVFDQSDPSVEGSSALEEFDFYEKVEVLSADAKGEDGSK